jgi:hypothetical protein
VTAAELWLRGRAEGVPPALFRAMVAALPREASVVPAALVTGAMHLYGAVASGTGDRSDALPLLAADALLTHAFEAQAEMAPAGLESLVSRCEDALGAIAP